MPPDSPLHFGTIEDGNAVTLPEGTFRYGKRGTAGTLHKRIKLADWNEHAPVIGEPHPTQDWLQVSDVVASFVKGTELVDFEIAYELVDGDENENPATSAPGIDILRPPPKEIHLDSSVRSVPIHLHPTFATWRGAQIGEIVTASGTTIPDYENWDSRKGEFRPGSAKYGITHYYRPTTQVVVTDYYTERPNASVVTGIIGTLAAPPAFAAGGSDNWLVLTGGIRRFGLFWGRTLVYQYDEAGWDSDVYA